MKTLDEVIKAKELCNDHKFRCHECSYYDDDNEVGCRSDDLDADALHYLREYLDYQKQAETVIKDAQLPDVENKALTWDELRQMEGKPVWVEGYYPSSWCIVRGVQVNKDGTEDIVLDGLNHMIGIGRDDKYGTGWQAFRKERYEES